MSLISGKNYTILEKFVENCFSLLPRQALHAQTLGFIHPESGEKMSFEIPLPNDFESALGKWRQYAQHKNL
jgi:23S rRNA pseudouridine1911/1915/1917 synthase